MYSMTEKKKKGHQLTDFDLQPELLSAVVCVYLANFQLETKKGVKAYNKLCRKRETGGETEMKK